MAREFLLSEKLQMPWKSDKRFNSSGKEQQFSESPNTSGLLIFEKIM
jgi:hypothetical protein